MITWLSLLLTAVNCLSEQPETDPRRGYPLYFGSFEEVGTNRIATDVLPTHLIDKQITEWTKGCPADAYLLIEDSSPFELTGLKRVQRAAENSLTVGSFLSENPIDLQELSLDLEDYCDARLINVDTTNLTRFEKYIDTRPRVFYVKFDEGMSPENKNETLTTIFGGTPTPFVTIIYASKIQQSQPILRNVKLNEKRLSWQRNKLRHNSEKIAPVIAPLFDHRGIGHSAPEPVLDLPDHFFFTLLIGSAVTVLFMMYRDYVRYRRSNATPKESKEKK